MGNDELEIMILGCIDGELTWVLARLLCIRISDLAYMAFGSYIKIMFSLVQ